MENNLIKVCKEIFESFIKSEGNLKRNHTTMHDVEYLDIKGNIIAKEICVDWGGRYEYYIKDSVIVFAELPNSDVTLVQMTDSTGYYNYLKEMYGIHNEKPITDK